MSSVWSSLTPIFQLDSMLCERDATGPAGYLQSAVDSEAKVSVGSGKKRDATYGPAAVCMLLAEWSRTVIEGWMLVDCGLSSSWSPSPSTVHRIAVVHKGADKEAAAEKAVSSPPNLGLIGTLVADMIQCNISWAKIDSVVVPL